MHNLYRVFAYETLWHLALDFSLSFLYVAAMFKATVIILGLVWASLLFISWSGAEDETIRVSAAPFEQRGF